MLKKYIKYVLVSLLVGSTMLFVSCEKWLSVSPKTEMKAEDMLSTESGFDDLLTGVYSLMSTDNSYGSYLTYSFMDVVAQYYNSPRDGIGSQEHTFKYASLYDFKASAEEGRVKAMWSFAYKSIANVNMGLKYIDENKSVFLTDTAYHVYKGEFYALRAMLHFDMLRLFGQAPAMENGAGMSSLSIPYYDTFTNVAQPQCTVREALNRIIADLQTAKTLMVTYDPYGPISETVAVPSNIRLGTRARRLNYYAVTALLARVYLYAGEKQNALTQAQEIIHDADIATPNEKIFKMATTAATAVAPLFVNEHLFVLDIQDLDKRMEKYVLEQGSTLQLIMKKDEYAAFFDKRGTSNDFRTPWLKATGSGTTYMLGKYANIKMIPLIALPEVYLIAAECAGDSDGRKYLNKIRFHRGLNAIPESDDLMTQIYKEYQREMLGAGQLFFFYKRNLYTRIGPLDNIELKNINENYVLPIPKLEVEFGKIKN